MSHSAARARPGQDRVSLYEEITNKIITELEAGRLPWVQPWGSSGVSAPLAMPKNAATGRAYSGINVLILWGAVVQHGFRQGAGIALDTEQEARVMSESKEPAPRKSGFAQTCEYDAYIARALATEGGHLSIGRGGATLHFERSRLSGCAEDVVKAAAIAAGLPVIDSRNVPFETAWALAVRGPMIAIGEAPSSPPYHAPSYASLGFVAEAYRAAGAEVFNLPPSANLAQGE